MILKEKVEARGSLKKAHPKDLSAYLLHSKRLDKWLPDGRRGRRPKNYVCPICGKDGFSRMKDLRRHKFEVHSYDLR